MDLKLDNNWTTLPCFYCNKRELWYNNWTKKFKMIVIEPDCLIVLLRVAQVGYSVSQYIQRNFQTCNKYAEIYTEIP